MRMNEWTEELNEAKIEWIMKSDAEMELTARKKEWNWSEQTVFDEAGNKQSQEWMISACRIKWN